MPCFIEFSNKHNKYIGNCIIFCANINGDVKGGDVSKDFRWNFNNWSQILGEGFEFWKNDR